MNSFKQKDQVRLIIFFILFLLIFKTNRLFAQEELKVKRRNIFEFTSKPIITEKDGSFTISFTSKDYCDVTISIENSNGDIVRHLASGVLGKNAPKPFQKNKLSQKIIWHGKDDAGRYVKTYDDLRIRVSLGLKPVYEKSLYWDPSRRQGREAPILKSSKEGVYVYDGGKGLDFVKLYNAKGDYVKTVYPFPGSKINKVKGLVKRKTIEGISLPVKPTSLQQSFLVTGNYHGYNSRSKDKVHPIKKLKRSNYQYGKSWYSSSFLAVKNKKIAIGMEYLARFQTDGTSGGMDVYGPSISMFAKRMGKVIPVAPRSGALSPDGKILYLTAYHYSEVSNAANDIMVTGKWHSFHGVFKKNLSDNSRPTLFVGSDKLDVMGNNNTSFNVPAHVATDNKGNVYVSDQLNNRVQIYTSKGKFIKSLLVTNPSQVCIEPFTKKVYVISSPVYAEGRGSKKRRKKKIESKLTVYSADFKKEASMALPKGFQKWIKPYRYAGGLGFPVSAAVLKNGSEINLWLTREWARENVMTRGKIKKTNIEIYSIVGNKLKLKNDFAKIIASKNIMSQPAKFNRQRLYLNPKSRKLYITEGINNYIGKAFKFIREIDPETDKVTRHELPFDALDMCFDQMGYIYLRNFEYVVRFDITTKPWREVAWDYGVEKKGIYTSPTSGFKKYNAVSALRMNGSNGDWHHGGMYVNLKGSLVVCCRNQRADSSYEYQNFKGRSVAGRGGTPFIHVWDKFGQIMFDDFVPGLADNTYGVGLDNDHNVYLLSSGVKLYDNKKHYNTMSGTLMKFPPKKGRILSSSKSISLPLDKASYPKRSGDIWNPSFGNAWVEGSEWLFGGVGWSGKNAGKGCSCWNARFSLDYYNRSFAPEVDRFSVAILDSAGNLILRAGSYGNVDSQGPKSKSPIGGDEIGLMHGAYLAVESDKRLFIADPANQRIVSAKLGYHKSEIISLSKFKVKK